MYVQIIASCEAINKFSSWHFFAADSLGASDFLRDVAFTACTVLLAVHQSGSERDILGVWSCEARAAHEWRAGGGGLEVRPASLLKDLMICEHSTA